MDLDALLGLFFFVMFVVVPMIAGARKKGKGQGQTGPQTGKGSQPGQRGAAAPTGQGTQAQRGTASSSTVQRGDHPASSTLEEIRRRVEQAQERESQRDAERATGRRGASASTQPASSRGLVSSDPFERGLVSGSGRSIAGEPLGMGREGRPVSGQPIGMGREGMSGQGLGREGVSREWPPSATDPLAGRSHTSVLGREGASGPIAGRQAQAGRSGLGREGQPSSGGAGQRGSLGREGGMQTAAQRRAVRSRGGLGREGYGGVDPIEAGERALLGREGVISRSERSAAAEIGGSGGRPGTAATGARLGRAALISADREGILHGLIWHEILSEAPGKKLLRRTR